MHKTYRDWKTTNDFDKFMLALLREKNQKYKIFGGNRNLENNPVNKLVTTIIWKISLQKLWICCSLAQCATCLITEYNTPMWLLSNHTYRSWLFPHPSTSNKNLSSLGCFTNKRKLGRLWSVSSMQSCFSALTWEPSFLKQPGIKLTSHSPKVFKDHFEASTYLRTTKIFWLMTVLTSCAYISKFSQSRVQLCSGPYHSHKTTKSWNG